MNTALINQMTVVADLAMQVWRAEDAADNTKAVYHRAIADYEEWHGYLHANIRKDAPEHAEVRAYTATKYKNLQLAKRRVYSLKKRLEKACAVLARIEAAHRVEAAPC